MAWIAWNVNDLIEFTRFLMNKYQGGDYTEKDFFYAWNSEQRMYMSDLLGRFQARNTGKTGLLQDETILTKLDPFTKNVTLTVTAGQVVKPADFIYKLALRIDGELVNILNKSQWYFLNKTVIDAPSISRGSYYATDYLNYYKLLPSSVTSVDLDYIADCIDIVWGNIPDGNNRPVYNPGTSVQPQWDNQSIVEITKRTLKSIGLHFSSQDFQNFGQSAILTGN